MAALTQYRLDPVSRFIFSLPTLKRWQVLHSKSPSIGGFRGPVQDINIPNQSSCHVPLATAPHILLFDLSVGGHHPGYIQHLIRYWGEHHLPGRLSIVVLPKFMTQHADVVACADHWGKNQIQFIPITLTEAATLADRRSFINRTRLAFQEWELFCRYARQLQVDHGVLLYLDTAQLPIIFGRRPPCPFSGIYFRPTFHYDTFAHYQPTRADRRRQWYDKLLLRQVLGHPQLATLLCLDPFVLPHLAQLHPRGSAGHLAVHHLPDPVQIYPQSQATVETLKQQLNIEPHRQVFLLFGALNSRKGLYQLLEALEKLSETDCQQLCLLMVGPLSQGDKPKVHQAIQALTQTRPLQIITHDCFITDQEIQPYFQLADVILAPYQRHVGMSAILVRAAAAQTPVLSTDYGLMGEITRRYQLGKTVEASDPAALAQGLKNCLQQPTTSLGNPDTMAAFAAQNTAELFARTCFEMVLSAVT